MINLDQTPHPLVEDHYHIRSLIEGQEKRTADRAYYQDRLKELEERSNLIKDSKPFALTEFYCDRCGKDFKSQAIKEVEIDWSNTTQSIAFYKTKCFQGHWCQRLITDRNKDRFWAKSKLVAMDRRVHKDDTLQPWETGFNLLYGKK